jgi:pyrroline-5-carboxylate reductase
LIENGRMEIMERYIRLGFIGTGVITSAIVTGLCTLPKPMASILVSPRNRKKAEKLASMFSNVKVASSNQDILDNVDVVVLAVLPQNREEILSLLKFVNNHTVINLLAGTANADIAPLVAPASRLIRSVPLPCVSRHIGPIALFPDDDIAREIFESLGIVIAVDQESQLESLTIITALMAPYYALLESVVNWVVKEGVGQKQASDYTASMFSALCAMAVELPDGKIGSLVQESMTPGGLNELAMETITTKEGLNPWMFALKKVKEKIEDSCNQGKQ